MLVALMTLAGSMQIFTRFFQIPAPWLEEFSRYAFVWATFIGASVALRIGSLACITLMRDRLPQKIQSLVLLTAQIAAILFIVTIMIKGFQLAFSQISQRSPCLRVSMIVPYMAVPVGFLLMLLQISEQTFKTLKSIFQRGDKR